MELFSEPRELSQSPGPPQGSWSPGTAPDLHRLLHPPGNLPDADLTQSRCLVTERVFFSAQVSLLWNRLPLIW